jgi:hypothetical protein
MTALAKRHDAFTETEIDDEIVVMLLDSGEFFSLTGTGRSIWLLLDGQRDRDALIAAVAREFRVESAAIAADVDEFLTALRDTGLLQKD